MSYNRDQNNSYNNRSLKKEFLDKLETRFKTIMIGSIARFENSFGYLWNENDDPRTDQEAFFRDKWEDLRTDILNHANNQIRQGIEEAAKFLDQAEKYTLKFIYSNNDNGRKN